MRPFLLRQSLTNLAWRNRKGRNSFYSFSIAAFSIAALKLTFCIVNFCSFLINTSRRSNGEAAIGALLYGPNKTMGMHSKNFSLYFYMRQLTCRRRYMRLHVLRISNSSSSSIMVFLWFICLLRSSYFYIRKFKIRTSSH